MSNFGHALKKAVTRGAKAIKRNSTRLVKATKFKTAEWADLGKKRDLIKALGEKVYDLAQNGIVLPEEAAELVQQISALDSDLAVLRADNEARKASDAQLRATEKASRAAEKAAAKAAAVIEMSTAPVQVEISPVEPAPAESAPDVPTIEVEATDAEKAEPNDIPTLNV